MPRVAFFADVTAEEMLAVFQSIPVGEEPASDIDIFASRATALFSNGVSALANFTANIFAGNATITDASVSDALGMRILNAMVGLDIDLDGNLSDPDALEGFDVFLLDDTDRLDADGFLAVVGVIQAAFLDIPIEPNLDGITVDFGTEPVIEDPLGPFDVSLYDTLVYDVARADIAETLNEDGSVSFASADGTGTAIELERLELTDGSYLYDLSEVAPFVYRLYAASLARTPDEPGLRFWDAVFSGGTLDALGLAQEFAQSPEFEMNFLDDPSDEGFINALYNNVLERDADQPGFDFWLGAFQDGQTRADMLLFFADSPENMDRNADNYDDGVWVLPLEDQMMG